jgi:hypothetical protein
MISSRFLSFAATLLLNQGAARAQMIPVCMIHVCPSYRNINDQILIFIQSMDNYLKCLQSQNGNINGSPIVLADCTGEIDANQQFEYLNRTVRMYGGAMCLVGGSAGNVLSLTHAGRHWRSKKQWDKGSDPEMLSGEPRSTVVVDTDVRLRL